MWLGVTEGWTNNMPNGNEVEEAFQQCYDAAA